MEEIEQFIDGLSIEELNILLRIINDRSHIEDIRSYIETCLNTEREFCTYEVDLLRDIPMSYLPISGIETHRICSFFDFVYNYFVLNYEDKKKIKSLGKRTILFIDSSVSFLQNYLVEELVDIQKKEKYINSGKGILDKDIKYKTQFILKNDSKIIDYLRQNGEDYIFSSLANRDYFSEKNIWNTFSILARYSHINDLKNDNITSFKKFIKTEKH